MKKKIRVGILGATGMVGQRFVTLLADHPWFEVVVVAASPSSSGKSYKEAVKGRWKMEVNVPESIAKLKVQVVTDIEKVTEQIDPDNVGTGFVFCALDMEKDAIQKLELAYAAAGVPVVSNNSAHRWTEDIPMLMPEINPEHVKLIDIQKKNRGFGRGFIAVKPNCSIQSYVSILTALKKFQPIEASVTSMQAISGAGKNFETWPEMVENVIPYIGGEEEKSEKEPLKIWGKVTKGTLTIAEKPTISATCVRVAVSDGHMAVVRVKFGKKVTKKQLLDAIEHFENPIAQLRLPSAPKKLIKYFEEDNRPQTKIDRDYASGMGITMGRLEPDKHFGWRFVSLSHNTIRGAAGGAVLMAEFLVKKGYI